MTTAGYLPQQEKKDTIPLWEEAFPEDGPEFLDYYYKEKTKDNRILAVWEADESTRRIISMVHRNPYRLWVNGHMADSDYIVAVATAADKRHQGLMRMLLTRMFEDMHKERMPFCYLMPADRRIYEPFDFAYVYDQEHWRVKGEAERKLVKRKVKPEDSQEAARWMEEWLEKRYQVFAIRDPWYIRRLLAELESEKGWMEFLYDSGNPIGIRCWWGTKEKEQRMLLCREEYREDERERTPAIMARLTDVERCLELVYLKKNSPFDRLKTVLYVEDPLCPWNHGIFLWEIGQERSSAVRLEERTESKDKTEKIKWSSLPGLHIEISLLTQWIFGYKKPEEKEKCASWWQYIDTWKKVFLDEVV